MKKILFILISLFLCNTITYAIDNDSDAGAPTNQIGSKTILSTVDTQNEAVDVFSFDIYDWGSGDGLETKVTNIRVTPYTTNTADWTNTIQGAFIDDGNNFIYPTVTINDNYLDLTFNVGDLNVPDNDYITVTIYIYLNTSNITDGSILSFFVDANNHGFTADPSGSTFATSFTGGDFYSNDMTINVEASQLAFTKQPTNVIINNIMNPVVKVAYTDENGNVDKTYDGSNYDISLTSSGASFSGTATTTKAPNQGVSNFDNLLFSSIGTGISLSANDGGWGNTDATSTVFKVINEPSGIIISEVADPADVSYAKFVEIYNPTTSDIDFSNETWYLVMENQLGNYSTKQLTGLLEAGNTMVLSYSASNFLSNYGFDSDLNSGLSGNGDDAYFLFYDGDNSTGTLVDIFGEFDTDGTGTAWDYTDKRASRNSNIVTHNTTWTASEWTITSANVADMTPGTHGDCITFNGSSTSAWGTAGNWVGGTAPASTKNVKIPSGLTNNPSVDGDATTPSECNSLTIASGASLTIPAGKALTVNGDLTNNATAAGLVVESDATGNGSVIVSGTETGDATVQRYIAGYTANDNGWHTICSPVDMTVAGSGWEPGTSSPDLDDLYYWDETTNQWMNYKAGAFTFTQGQGYLVAYETGATKEFTGSLRTLSISHTDLSRDNNNGNGWHLLGNPFSSAIEWNNNGDWVFTNIGSVPSVYDENGKSYVNPADGDPIPATNGFFVQVADTYSGNNTITIPASARVHNSHNNYKNVVSNSEANTLRMTVTTDANTYYNKIRVGFKADATQEWDVKYDAHKLFGGEDTPELWTVSNGEEFSVNTLPFNQQPIDLPLNFKAGADGNYTITFEGVDSFNANSSITLEDLFTGKTTDIHQNETYSYSAAKGDANNRFVLHFYNVTSTPEIQGQSNKALIYTYNHSIILKANSSSLNGTVEVVNILGQTMNVQPVSNVTFKRFSADYQPGIYIIRYRETDGYVQTQKVVIN